MKRRLFWKILVGFWITFMVIINGTWLLFSLLRPSPEVSEYSRSMAKMSVDAASAMIRLDGEHSFQAALNGWPRDQRHQLEVRPATQRPNPKPALARTTVAAPDGTSYLISYYPRIIDHSHDFPGIPGVTSLVAALGGLAFSAVLAWYLTQPFQRMRVGFGRLAQGDFATRLGPAMGRRRDEIADLAYDFDKMAMRLEELVAARDRLLADVSHELRTPLARLNLAIELARQDPAKIATSLDRIGGEAAKLDEMVGELLTLAKLESGHSRNEDYFNFAEIVKAVVHDARYEAAPKNVEVSLDVEPDNGDSEWIVLGSGRLISRAVENIVRNAVRYSGEGGKVKATLTRVGPSFRLLVTDQGPGVSQDSMGGIFQPFSVSADGFGFGLGLAIAQRAIMVHGGTIAARNCQPKGLAMTVTLPAAGIESA